MVESTGDSSVRRNVFNVSACPHCGCCLTDASVYDVLQPTLWTVWQFGAPAIIEWKSTVVPSSVVNVSLLLTYSNGSVSNVATLAQAIPNTGRVVWNVTAFTPSSSRYRVSIVPSQGGSVSGSSAVSDFFTIIPSVSVDHMCPASSTQAWAPSGPAVCARAQEVQCQALPAPVAEQLRYACGFCSRSEFSSARRLAASASAVATVTASQYSNCSQCCTACPEGFVTSTRGDWGTQSCTVREGSELDQFEEIRHVGLRLAEAWVYQVLPSPTTAENCARTCALDERCRAFDFLMCSATSVVSNVSASSRYGLYRSCMQNGVQK